MNQKRQKVTEPVARLDLEFFDGDVQGIIYELQKFLKSESPDTIALQIKVDQHYENVDFILIRHRLETNKEYDFRRIKEKATRTKAKKERDAAKENRRIVFEKLKKEFEPK